MERPCLDFIRGRIPSCGPGEGAWCRLMIVSEAVGFSRHQSATPEAVLLWGRTLREIRGAGD